MPVSGYEELYQVSSLGQVRSIPRQTRKGVLGGRVLKQHPNTSGHLKVTLSKDGKCISKDVHKLVAGAFLPPQRPGMEVCHGERGQQCNWWTNLRYDTHRANMQDRLNDGNYANAAKEHCLRCLGPYTERKNGSRYCAECNRKDSAKRARERRERERAARLAANGPLITQP